MAAVTRTGDHTTGVCDLGLPCCPHGRSGVNAQASPDVLINGKGAHRRGDDGPTNCPHSGVFKSVGASGGVYVNGRPVTRVGDETRCIQCGQAGAHAEGSENVFAG